MKRIVSTLLVAVMLFGAVVGLIPAATTRVYAEEPEVTLGGYLGATETALTTSYKDVADKILNGGMQLMLAVDAQNGCTYQIYCNPYTGEVIYKNVTTGECLTTNPYDAGASTSISATIKERLLSQVVVTYKGTDGNLKTMYSFTEAAQRGQIKVKSIKNGIRVQYTIGRENATYLMPGWITKARFEEEIQGPLDAYVAEIEEQYGRNSDEYKWASFYRGRVLSVYTLQDPNKYSDDATGQAMKKKMQSTFKITAEIDPSTGENYVIYTVAEDLTDVQKSSFETIIRTYCPDYTYDDLDKDNTLTGYESKQETPPLFKLSLEYTINKADGSLDIRLPANGILYDETLFQLESISTLNYLGAGRMDISTYDTYIADHPEQFAGIDDNKDRAYFGNAGDEIVCDGYVFYPDGSGTLFEFSDLYTATNKVSVSWTSKVYGQDYAYYTISGKSQEQIRMPVYGIVSTVGVEPVLLKNADGSVKKNDKNQALYDLVPVKSGFLAILEEGEAMTNLTVNFGATRHNYASVYASYLPRPKDTYDLADSVSVSGNTEWTVVADRKYTGSYRTRVILLSDAENAEYKASWVGMATAYRDYLVNNGTLTALTDADVQADIPLYLEAFGAYETTQQFLSMPIDVKVPLTTFDDIRDIYNDLSTNSGITNINFKLTGFANGGMAATYPAKLDWEGAVGGADGFRDLIAAAEEYGFGVYPEFEFSYISNEAAFDGVSLKGLGARTVDNRYCSKQIYDAVYQQFTNFFDMCVSTNLIATYYDKFSSRLSGFSENGSFGLSAGSLGTDLNSNFDEDNPINREEAKADIISLLKTMQSEYKSVMLSGGNSYTLGYADHILDLPMDGSNYRYASASVPFVAMILHGYVNYAGSALNMTGDTDYTVLKSIESGASPYYLLSYNTENTMLLKKDELLNKYYSIRYDIWRWSDADNREGDGTIVEQYKLLNAALHDLQTAVMIDHQFIQGERVLQASEKQNQKNDLVEAVLEAISAEINAKNEALLDVLAKKLKFYNVLAPYDVKIQEIMNNTSLTAARKKTNIKNLFKDNSSVTEDMINEIYTAYNVGGGLADYKVERGLYTQCNVDIELLWTSVLAGVRNVLNETELAALRQQVEDLVAKESQNATVTLYTDLTAILGQKPTNADVDLFNLLIYTGIDKATITTRAKTGFSVALDDEKAAALADLVLAARSDKDAEGNEKLRQVLTVVNSVNIDFNFNVTDSDATAGTGYADTDFTLEDQRLVLVTYKKADGSLVKFILNYNIFDVEVKLDGKTYAIESYGFVRIDCNTTTAGGEG